jgi:hypothetical protein
MNREQALNYVLGIVGSTTLGPDERKYVRNCLAYLINDFCNRMDRQTAIIEDIALALKDIKHHYAHHILKKHEPI